MEYDPTKPVSEENVPPFDLQPGAVQQSEGKGEKPIPLASSDMDALEALRKKLADEANSGSLLTIDEELEALEKENRLNAARYENAHSGWEFALLTKIDAVKVSLGLAGFAGIVALVVRGCG